MVRICTISCPKIVFVVSDTFFCTTFVAMKLRMFTLLPVLVAMSALSAMSQIPDSLLTYARLKSMIVESPDSVLRLLDIAEKRRMPSMPMYRIDLLRAMAYNELHMISLKERYALKVLEDDSVADHPDIRLNAMVMALSAQSFYSDYKASLPMAMDAIRLAREIGNRPGEYNILQTVASDAFQFGDRKQGYEYLEQVIGPGYKSDDIRELANVSSAIGIKVIQLYADGRYSDALAESRRRMDVIDRIDRLGGAPAGFTDQQRAYTYARVASSAWMAGDKHQADAAYKRFMATDYAATDYGRAFIVDYLIESRQYDKVLEVTKPLYGLLQQTDTINEDYWSLLYSNARACFGLGYTDRGLSLMDRAFAVRDSIMKREQRNHGQELAIMFELEDKELALSQAREESSRRLVMLIIAVAVVVIVVILLIALVMHNRMVMRRNRLAARRIDELMNQRGLLRIRTDAESAEDASGYEEFVRMERIVMHEKLFLQPNCNRDTIADRCSMSRPAVIRLIRQFAGGTVNEYINRLKLEYSVMLIKEHPDWTIEAIAQASGFNTRSTYYLHFNKAFGITPAQYAAQQSGAQ